MKWGSVSQQSARRRAEVSDKGPLRLSRARRSPKGCLFVGPCADALCRRRDGRGNGPCREPRRDGVSKDRVNMRQLAGNCSDVARIIVPIGLRTGLRGAQDDAGRVPEPSGRALAAAQAEARTPPGVTGRAMRRLSDEGVVFGAWSADIATAFGAVVANSTWGSGRYAAVGSGEAEREGRVASRADGSASPVLVEAVSVGCPPDPPRCQEAERGGQFSGACVNCGPLYGKSALGRRRRRGRLSQSSLVRAGL